MSVLFYILSGMPLGAQFILPRPTAVRLHSAAARHTVMDGVCVAHCAVIVVAQRSVVTVGGRCVSKRIFQFNGYFHNVLFRDWCSSSAVADKPVHEYDR